MERLNISTFDGAARNNARQSFSVNLIMEKKRNTARNAPHHASFHFDAFSSA